MFNFGKKTANFKRNHTCGEDTTTYGRAFTEVEESTAQNDRPLHDYIQDMRDEYEISHQRSIETSGFISYNDKYRY